MQADGTNPVLTDEELQKLESFLADEARHDDALDLDQLQGFLFAIASCPMPPEEGEWMPVIFGENGDDQAHPEIVALVRRLHDSIRQDIEQGTWTLPERCVFSWDNWERRYLDAWVEGFLMTDEWLEDHWRQALAAARHKHLDGYSEFAEALDEILAFMQIYADIDDALETVEREQPDRADEFREQLARGRENIQEELRVYAEVGQRLSRVLSPGVTITRELPKVGRNDPCPCGSGKKFKKCCGT
ncbi:UPF0149 family protein [Hahella sp. SMD15-11]|uniref:UPF0149 family protein n=1 Tax=Thermohahella caldifontis TaxID=3142973 RepID=A0AB39UZJ1_9GAMM